MAFVCNRRKETHLSSIEELNNPSFVDSHSLAKGRAVFELNRRELYEIDRGVLRCTDPFYPRVKRLKDGFVLFFNNGKTGPSVYYSRSDTLAFEKEAEPLFEGDKERFYATCDAVVLDNGDILAAASFRPASYAEYISDMEKSGIAIRVSSDGARSWSDIRIIYVGMNWEPYLMQLESGEVHCYFTHTAPYTYLYGYNHNIRSSGAALIRSFDRGASWTPYVTKPPYSADIVMQTYIGIEKEKPFFNDQMPVAVELHNKSIMLACETLNLNKQFRISIGLSHDNWSRPLGREEEGPTEKYVTSTHGSGPYVAQMKSGETVVSYYSGDMNMLVGDCEGRRFYPPIKPMERVSKTYWGALEVLGDHTLLTVQDSPVEDTDDGGRKIVLSKLVLNHDIEAQRMSAVIDADPNDWMQNRDAIFVGSESQAQATLRFAYDDENVYLLCERLDKYLSGVGDKTTLCFSVDEGIWYEIELSATGDVHAFKCSERVRTELNGGYHAELKVIGTVDDDTDIDVGYIAELCISKNLLCMSDCGFLRATITLENSDLEKCYPTDTVISHIIGDPQTWQYVWLNDY